MRSHLHALARNRLISDALDGHRRHVCRCWEDCNEQLVGAGYNYLKNRSGPLPAMSGVAGRRGIEQGPLSRSDAK
jgi:hypothetical protein